MEKTANLNIEGEIAFIDMNYPPMNSLCQSLRANLKSCLESALEDNAVFVE